jgi:hypothetical protein
MDRVIRISPYPSAGRGNQDYDLDMSKRAELELSDFLLLEKTPNCITWLCPYPKPILNAIGIQLDLRGLLQWVIGPDCFTHTPVPGPGPLNYHHAVKRFLLFANSGQSNR